MEFEQFKDEAANYLEDAGIAYSQALDEKLWALYPSMRLRSDTAVLKPAPGAGADFLRRNAAVLTPAVAPAVRH